MKKAIIAVSGVMALACLAGAFIWWQEPVRKLERQAQAGQISAMIELADHYLAAEPAELEPAAHWLEQAARSGHLATARRLVKAYADPKHPLGADPAKQREWTHYLARRGDAASQFEYAELERSDERLTEEGVNWMRQSARQDYAPAAFALAEHKIASEGYSLRAMRSLRQAADLYHPPARYKLGLYQLENAKTERQRFDAARMLITAAQAGVDEALLPAVEILLKRPTRSVRSYLRPVLMKAWEDGRSDVVPHIATLRRASRSDDAMRWHLKSAALGYSDWLPTVAAMKAAETTATDWEIAAWRALEELQGDTFTGLPAFLEELENWQWLQAMALIEAVLDLVPESASPPFTLEAVPEIEDRIHRLHLESHDRLLELAGSYEMLATGFVVTTPESLLEHMQAENWPIQNPHLNVRFSLHLYAQGLVSAWQDAYHRLLDLEQDAQAQNLLTIGFSRRVPAALWIWANSAMNDPAHPAGDSRINDWLAMAASEQEEAESALRMRLHSAIGISAESELQRPFLIELASEGHAESQTALALWARTATAEAESTIGRDIIHTYLRAAADRGHAEAAYLMSDDLRVSLGDGEYGYSEKARHYLEMAAENGHVDAMFWLGSLLLSMDREDRDLMASYKWIRRAAEGGHRHARHFFTDFSEGERVGAHRSLFNAFYRATVLDEPEAMVEIGNYYLWNQYSPSIEEGLHWLERAAEQHYFPAFHAIAGLYVRGTRVERDPLRALRWLEAAAELGDGESSFVIANQYLAGTHLPRDTDRAQRHLLRAAEQGHLPAIEMIRYSEDFRGMVRESGATAQLDQLEGQIDLRAFYPVRPVTVLRGQAQSIINVSRLRPIIDLGNRNLRLSADVSQHLMPAQAYHSATITELKLTYETPYWRDGENFVVTGGDPRLVGEIRVDRDLQDVLMLVVNENKAHEPKFHWFRIGNLRADRSSRISEFLPEIIWDRNDLSIFFFSGGKELLSPLRKQAIYRNRPVDSRFQSAKLDGQRNTDPTETRGAELWSAADTRFVSDRLESGTEIEFLLNINSLGLVDGFELISEGFEEIPDSVIQGLLKLQFYPALEEGIPVASTKIRTLTVF
ncbi:MAG: sel1 repeat family protein [Opitutales bacterium]|nr:sel1 repeat family protein [Opitutales bacterium]